jgi:hypothetical protein
VRLIARPLPDGHGTQFLWRGEIVGELRWREDGDPPGWWARLPSGEQRLICRCPPELSVFERAQLRRREEPASRWFAQSMVSAEIAQARNEQLGGRMPPDTTA